VNLRMSLAAVVIAAALVAAFLTGRQTPPAAGRADDRATPCPRYSIVETEGHNLIVTDNQTNHLYFYNLDKDKDVGSELRLRATVDLSQVGKPVIAVKHHKADKPG
jgi:hypothetical protein